MYSTLNDVVNDTLFGLQSDPFCNERQGQYHTLPEKKEPDRVSGKIASKRARYWCHSRNPTMRRKATETGGGKKIRKYGTNSFSAVSPAFAEFADLLAMRHMERTGLCSIPPCSRGTHLTRRKRLKRFHREKKRNTQKEKKVKRTGTCDSPDSQ